MSVPMALEQHAYFGSGSSRRLAQQWLAQRQMKGDPVAAMRALGSQARDEADRFAQETLTICLEYPNGDHGKVLAAAIDHIGAARGQRTAPRFKVMAALALSGATTIELARLMFAGLEG